MVSPGVIGALGGRIGRAIPSFDQYYGSEPVTTPQNTITSGADSGSGSLRDVLAGAASTGGQVIIDRDVSLRNKITAIGNSALDLNIIATNGAVIRGNELAIQSFRNVSVYDVAAYGAVARYVGSVTATDAMSFRNNQNVHVKRSSLCMGFDGNSDAIVNGDGSITYELCNLSFGLEPAKSSLITSQSARSLARYLNCLIQGNFSRPNTQNVAGLLAGCIVSNQAAPATSIERVGPADLPSSCDYYDNMLLLGNNGGGNAEYARALFAAENIHIFDGGGNQIRQPATLGTDARTGTLLTPASIFELQAGSSINGCDPHIRPYPFRDWSGDTQWTSASALDLDDVGPTVRDPLTAEAVRQITQSDGLDHIVQTGASLRYVPHLNATVTGDPDRVAIGQTSYTGGLYKLPIRQCYLFGSNVELPGTRNIRIRIWAAGQPTSTTPIYDASGLAGTSPRTWAPASGSLPSTIWDATSQEFRLHDDQDVNDALFLDLSGQPDDNDLRCQIDSLDSPGSVDGHPAEPASQVQFDLLHS